MYLKISLVPMIIMGVVLVLNKSINYKFKISDLVLLVPLIMIIIAGDGNLSMALANNRVSRISKNKTTNTVINEKEEIKEEQQEQQEQQEQVVPKEEKIDLDDIYFDIKDSTYSYLADYLTYTNGARKFIGKTIRVRGFTVDYSEYFSKDYFAIGKYMISCCAADAEFGGFVVKYPFSKVKMNTWYEIEGVLVSGKDIDGDDIVAIEAINVKEISSKGEEQYVYQCNNYGDGKCSELQQYDLEY